MQSSEHAQARWHCSSPCCLELQQSEDSDALVDGVRGSGDEGGNLDALAGCGRMFSVNVH